MALAIKVRPTLTPDGVSIIVDALTTKMDILMAKGNYNDPSLFKVLQVLNYMKTQDTALATNARNTIQQATQAVSSDILQTSEPITTPIKTTVNQSPLDIPDLTDNQIFDILSLVDSTRRTEAENEWYLSKGTLIMIQRMSSSRAIIKDEEL